MPDRRSGHSCFVLEISGRGVEALDNEAGGHRIQRIPPTEKRGRVHSSTVTVAVLDPGGASACPEFRETDVDLEWFGGTTGAGGQHRNKHENACRLTHRPTGIVKTAQTRSRKASRQLAMEALEEAVMRQGTAHAASEANLDRRRQIGSGQRSDKRRTWRFQEDQVHDHVTGRQERVAKAMNGGFAKLWS